MKMTFDEYDNMIDKFDELKTKVVWPTYEQIEMFKENPDKWIKFACYILEKADAPINQTEKYCKSNLNAFVNENLELIGEE